MTQISLPFSPEEATKNLMKKLPSRRMRDVVEKRFGLKGGKKKTLEAIGKEYKVTRERVRQIENDAIKFLSQKENLSEAEPIINSLQAHIGEHGAVLAENHLFSQLEAPRHAAHVAFLLELAPVFVRRPETAAFHSRWAVDPNKAELAEKILQGTHDHLDGLGKTVSQEELHGAILSKAKEAGQDLPENVRNAYVALSRVIKKNPYGEYGCASWPTINPRGVRDKAYLVLSKEKKPMHFREVAQSINELQWNRKKAHPQTVHNELIKDPRFVLVGRGLYALKEWGYEPGTVRDILVNLFKEAGRPLSREEVVKLVLEKRFVKPPTILLNLQDKNLFRRVEGEKYTLS